MRKIALVIGGGAFGTSIASVLSWNFDEVLVKVRSQDLYNGLLQGVNEVYLPGQNLSSKITPVLEWDEINASEIGLIISGLPTKALHSYFTENRERVIPILRLKVPFVSLSKGIDPDRLLFPDDILFEIFPKFTEQMSFLSGPSFAKEIVDEQLTLVSLAGKSRENLERTVKLLDTKFFKLFPTYDIKGVLLGGALKNVLAIACGIIEGLGFNHNTRAALLTRGIQEMLRFGVVFNARPETFYSYSGMGDLILTSTGDLSRNKTFGLEISKGKKPLEIIEEMKTVVEGYQTTKAVYKIAEKYKVRTLVFLGVYRVLFEETPPRDIVAEVMNNPSKVDF